MQTCVSGTTVESLAQECVDLITERVDKIIDEKLADKGDNIITIAIHHLF